MYGSRISAMCVGFGSSLGESMRFAFLRAKAAGALDEIPGLVYPRGETDGVAEELVDTGIQRLLGDLDELPDPVNGYRLLEPPSRAQLLGSQPLAANRVRRHSPLAHSESRRAGT